MMEPVFHTNDTRAIHVFTIPKKLQVEGLPTSFGMVELKNSEINRCKARVKGEFNRLFDEQVKASVVELDGRAVGADVALVEAFYDRCGQKVMTLLAAAYNKVNMPEDDDMLSFLNGSETRV